MGCHDDVWRRAEFERVGWIGVDGGFGFVDVEGGAGDAACSKGAEEGFFFDDGSSSGINQIRAFFHERKLFGRDKMSCFWEKWDVEGNHIRALKERVYGVNNVVPGDGDGSGYEAFRGDAERKNIAKLNGEVLPDCEQQTGMSALFTAMSRDLEAAGYAGKRVLAADLFTLFWMFGDFQPVKGAAPWYYGGVPGVENADLIVVPLCPIAKNVRAEMLKALEQSGRTLTVVRRTPLYVAIETSRD